MRHVTDLRLLYLSSVLLLTAQTPPAGGSGWAVIPLKEYDELRAKLAPPESGGEAPSINATLTRVDYQLDATKETHASGSVTLVIDVLGDGWTQVPLPPGLLIGGAKLPPSCQLLEGAVALTKKGRFVIQLDVSIPVAFVNGEQRVSLPANNSGITRSILKLNRTGIEVTATGGLLQDPEADPSVAHANGPGPLVLAWRRKVQEHREELPLKQTAELLQLWSLGEDSSMFTAEVTLDVQQGLARQFEFALPQELTVNQILGGNAGDWSVKAGTLTVSFLEPVDKQTKFLIQGEAKLPRDGKVRLPLIRIAAVDRESGGAAVELVGPAEVKNAVPSGMEPVEATRLGGIAATRQSPSLVAFRTLPQATARALEIEVARYTPQALLTANVEEARIQALMAADGKVLIRARYAVRNTQRSFLKMRLPAGATLWSAKLSRRPVRPGAGPDGSFLFPLSKPSSEDAPAFLIEITYLYKSQPWTDRGVAALSLPVLDLPVSRSGVILYLPPRYRVTPEPGAFRAAEFAEPESAAFHAQAAPPMIRPAGQLWNTRAAQNSQVLVDQFRSRRASQQPVRPTGGFDFPSYGPSVFLTSELAAENQEPRINLTFQHDPKGGSK